MVLNRDQSSRISIQNDQPIAIYDDIVTICVAERTSHPADRRPNTHTNTSTSASTSSQPDQPAATAVKTEPKPEPGRADSSARDTRPPPPSSAAAAPAAGDSEWERLFDEPLINGHGGGGEVNSTAAGRLRVEDADLDEQVQSAIKSILNLPRSDGDPAAPPQPPPPQPPPPSRFNINASFFNAEEAAESSEALDEAVRSILL